MPDLTIEHYYVCESALEFSCEIKGSQTYTVRYGYTPNGPYQRDWSCDCKGFKYHKVCKHVELAKQNWCGWQQFIHGDNPVERDNGKVCPKCNRPVYTERYGV